MREAIINQIIKQERQLLDKTDSLDVLTALIDDEFVEIGSNAVIVDKAEVSRWLASSSQSECIGTSFKAHWLAEHIILLTYISTIKDTPFATGKRAARSSIWRWTDGQWRMVFHQGTPLKKES